MAASIKVYTEGTLLKRPRARKNHPHIMRFQERFCRLTSSSLEYYETKDKKVSQKGCFEVKHIRIVEEVPDNVFKKTFCFQIGDDKEMMYLAAFTNESRNMWIEAFRQVAADSGNKMLQWYHDGVFGKTLSHPTPCWSCCGMMHENSIGCKKTTGAQTNTQSLPNYTSTIPVADNKSGNLPLSQSLPVPIRTVTSQAAATENRLIPHITMSQFKDSPSHRSRSLTKDSGTGDSVRYSQETQYGSLDDFLEANANAHRGDGGKGDSARSSRVTQFGSLDSLLEEIDEEKGYHHHLQSELKHERSDRDWPFDESHSDHSEESQKTGESLITIPSTPNTEHPYSEHTSISTTSTLSPVDSDYEVTQQHAKDVLSLKLEDMSVNKTTLLHHASRKGSKSVIQGILQDPEVNVNPVDAELHRVPLHEAAMAGHSDAVKLLLEKKADPFARDINNETPYDLAMKENHKEVMGILQDSMLPATSTCTSTLTSSPSHLASHNVKVPVFYDDKTLVSTSMNSVQMWDLLPDLTLDLSVETAEAESSFRLHDLKTHNESSSIMDTLSGDHFNLHSYTPFHSLHTSGSVTALAFPDDTHTLISASAESSVQIWNASANTLEGNISTAGETSSLSIWGSFLAIGSNLIQLVDFSNEQERRILIADDVSLQNPPMQLVAFGPQGYLVTVNGESNTVKVWPPPSEVQEFLSDPVWSSGCILSSTKNFICSLSASTNEEQPWLVVGESAGCVHLLNWKEEEKTYHTLFPENNRVGKTSTAISHCGENVAASCGGCLLTWEINSRDILFVIPKHPGDQNTSSLCYSPDDAHLAVGMSTGEVVVYDSWTGDSIFTLKEPQVSQNAISAMAYSGSGSYFAAGYNNGKVQIWTTSYTEDSPKAKRNNFKIAHKSEESTKPNFCSDLPLIGRVEDEIQSREEEYILQFLDYKIVIPANATREGRKIPFQTGEMPLGPVGPFKFPPNTRPVSSIVWFHSNEMINLQKPIKIVLSHCLNFTNEDDLKRMVFVKAGDNDFRVNEIGEKEFYFHTVREEEKEGEPLFTSEDGTLTTRYNCWYTICEKLLKESREEFDHTRYCLTRIVSKHMTEEKHEIRFILSYFLQSCMEMIKEQYSETHNITRTTVTFTTQGPNPCLGLEFENILPKGWIVACSSGQPIEVKDVCFLNKSQRDLILALEYEQYPPNIVLDADGAEATGNTILKIKFIGADKELKQEVILKKSDPVQVATPKDPVASLSHFQCTEGHEDVTTGKHVYNYQSMQNMPSGTQQPATPQRFHTEYASHHNEYYSSSPAQSTEVNPEVLPLEEVAKVPGPRNGDTVQD